MTDSPLPGPSQRILPSALAVGACLPPNHELCQLPESVDGVANQSVAVREWGDEIVFLRQLKEGGASRSYGIQCARLAGLPRPVVDRARSLLTRFEKHAPRDARQQLSLFITGTAPAEADDRPHEAAELADELRTVLEGINPDELTPREALDLLYKLKDLS